MPIHKNCLNDVIGYFPIALSVIRLEAWFKYSIQSFVLEWVSVWVGAVVSVEVRHGGITAQAGAVLWDVAFRAAVYGADLFAIAFFDVGNELPVSPALAEVSDERQLVSLEFLVFWGMRIIESPLFEWNVSADKHDQPAVLLIKVLNKL